MSVEPDEIREAVRAVIEDYDKMLSRAVRRADAALATAQDYAQRLVAMEDALHALVRAGSGVLVDDYQDRLEDPVGHDERQPYHRIHTKALDDLAGALASARAHLAEGKAS